MMGEMAEYFKNWLAKKLQCPREKMPLVLLYSMKEGTGKTLLLDFITLVFGAEYVTSTTGTKDILGDFNGSCERNLLTIINEGKDDGASIIDKEAFKSRITDVTTSIRKLYKEARQGENWSCYVLVTNNKHSIAVGSSDRRTAAVECSCAKVGDVDYFTKLRAAIDSPQSVEKYFNRNVAAFNPRIIPETKLRMDLKEQSKNTALKHIQEICENKRLQFCTNLVEEVFKVKPLYADYRAYCIESGVQPKFLFKESAYKEKLIDELGLEYKQFGTRGGRVTGFLLNYEDLNLAYQKLNYSAFKREELDEEAED
jgi:hypothetical protein